MGYIKLFFPILDEEIETTTGNTTHSKSHLFKVAGMSLEIRTSEPQVLIICSGSEKEHLMCWHVILHIGPASFAQVSTACMSRMWLNLNCFCCVGWRIWVEILLTGMSCLKLIILLQSASGLSAIVNLSLTVYCTDRRNNHSTTILAILLMNWPHISLFTFFKRYRAALWVT